MPTDTIKKEWVKQLIDSDLAFLETEKEFLESLEIKNNTEIKSIMLHQSYRIDVLKKIKIDWKL